MKYSKLLFSYITKSLNEVKIYSVNSTFLTLDPGNFSLPGVCCLTCRLFIMTFVQDKKDVEKVGATPLSDNNPSDHYLYVLIIHTGQLPNSGTDSKVGHTSVFFFIFLSFFLRFGLSCYGRLMQTMC